MDIQPGDVLFVWGRGIIPEFIEKVTDGPSHVALFIDQNRVIEAQGGKLVGEQDLSFYLGSDARMEVWTDPGLTDEQRKRMVYIAYSLYGTPYDYYLIPLEFFRFEFGLKLKWYEENHHLVCSTFVNNAATGAGAKWTDIPNPAPVDLLKGGVLQKKGELNQRTVQVS